jgi:CheY-like chemotaxis protein
MFLPIREQRRARILVVDDELPVAAMLSRVLDEEHDVQVATSAEQALEMLEQERFDVVFCDLLMPTMSGMDFYVEVMRRFPGQEKCIAFMSGGAFTARATRFLSRVQNPRIEKPFDLRAVRAVVQELMGREG